MTKFLAILKREYNTRVRTKMFIVATVLGPLMILLFTVVPALIFSLKAGGPTRLAVVDESERMYERVRGSLLNERGEDEGGAPAEKPAMPAPNTNAQERMRQAGEAVRATFDVRQVPLGGRSLDSIQQELNEQVLKDQLDGYVIIPKSVLESGEIEYNGRNTGDVVTSNQIRERISSAVRDQRMADNKINPQLMDEINKPVRMVTNKVTETGREQDSGQGFAFVFIVGFLIYITIIMYGQVVLAAVVEEKETRIAELLFSSVRSFPLLIGKLIGVSLVALTQLAIWALAFGAFAMWGVNALSASGLSISLPHIPASFFVYFFLFFLLGYFIYATFYALVGSMVTT
ncbi:MAG TPA: ABC transporter permease, partial [Pyrinomonadaceae bacterium]